MLLLKRFKSNILPLTNIPNLKSCIRTNSNATNLKKKPNRKVTDQKVINSDLIKLIDKHHSSILYSSFIEEKRKRLGYVHRRKTVTLGKFLEEREHHEAIREAQNQEPLPLCLKYLDDKDITHSNTKNVSQNIAEPEEVLPTHFPFKDITGTVVESTTNKTEVDERLSEDRTVALEAEVRFRQEVCTDEKVMRWMADYDNYEDGMEEELAENSWTHNYGTPDPNSRISNVPCGGCGALLHCKVHFSF